MKRKKKSNIFGIIVGVVAFAVFVFSAYKVWEKWHEYSEGRDFYDGIAEGAKISNDTPNDGVDISLLPPFSVDFDKLLAENGDVVAWIYCPGTNIDYPVVQSYDNDYYLRRMLNRQYHINGTIFMDYRFHSDFSDLNTVIYGHNMNDGSMFGDLPGYKKQEFFDEHPTMWLFTPDKTYRLELFAGFVTDSNSREVYGVCTDKDDFADYLSYAVSHSVFTSDVDMESVERVVVLSTCSYETDHSRFVVYGSLVPVD